jgi:hypothetical protein
MLLSASSAKTVLCPSPNGQVKSKLEAASGRRAVEKAHVHFFDFVFGFASVPLYAAYAKVSALTAAVSLPTCGSVRGTLTCDTVPLENLNRLDYTSRVTATGVRTDRP